MLGGANPFLLPLRTTSHSYPATNYTLEPQPLADVQLELLICYIWVFLHLCALIREQPRKLSCFFPTSLVVLELLTSPSQRESLLPGLCSVTLPAVLSTSRLLIVSENDANIGGSQAGSGGGASEMRAAGMDYAREHQVVWSRVRAPRNSCAYLTSCHFFFISSLLVPETSGVRRV